ncbi:PAS domain S-box protein [Pelomonas sp. APW6]|uniref:histidine kinase n=1 Tax=Roseateles subflavus TaxID=3053353 RepID=A0ABT7LIZ5_9BURK|nr:ATP-binding protein [Pelomonas sp. APW6]MDL5032833.1 PAS domain S-box protein [Pelomonas sp. APW6]
MKPTFSLKDLQQTAGRIIALTLGYAGVGLLSLKLAMAPNYAIPLFPSAGLALAALLCWGLRASPGVLLGSLLLNLVLGEERGQMSWLNSGVIGLGAMAQALVGVLLIRRWLPGTLVLVDPRDLLRFNLLGAGVAGVISASVATLTLSNAGALAPDQALDSWLSWWMGDALGVLIGAPILLCLIGRPHAVWAPRRLNVALPLLLATVLMSYGTQVVQSWNYEAARNAFEREADALLATGRQALLQPLVPVQALALQLEQAPGMGQQTFRQVASPWLTPSANALGYAARVERHEAHRLDETAVRDGLPDFRSRDRQRTGDLRPPPTEAMMVIRHIEPQRSNQGALGTNVLSIPEARQAVLAALEGRQPVASAAFMLSQYTRPTLGVVVYRAVRPVQAPAGREPVGVVFTTLRPDLLLSQVPHSPKGLLLCLMDRSEGAGRQIAGAPDCANRRAELPEREIQLDFAGRRWTLAAYMPRNDLGTLASASSLPFVVVAMFSTALLGALLLSVTGRTSTVQALVRDRTAALRHEIAERERATAALKDRERRFSNIFENAPIGIVFTELDGAVREANPRFCEMLGYSLQGLLGRRTLDMTHPEDRAQDKRLGQALLRGDISSYQRTKRYLHEDGSVVDVRALVSVLRDEDGQPYSLLGVVEDIGDQRRLQDLERAREAAEAASAAKNEFLSRMSHELRTPLNAMLGFAQLLGLEGQPGGLSPRQQEWTRQIQQAGWHLLEMINDTLDLSRIESGDMRLTLDRQDVPALVQEVAALLQGQLRQQAGRIVVELDPAAQWVQADVTRLKQVLSNLLSNAIKYNRPGGEVRISSRRTAEGFTEIRVLDQGPGLTPAQQSQLFQPFNRLGQENGTIDGTGIGLVISRRLAELMGGSLDFEPHEGDGACFVLRLAAAEPPPPSAQARPGIAQRHYGLTHDVLYIEDNPVNAELMLAMLAQRPSLQCEIREDGRSGLAALHERRPDLLLLDMQLPDMDGLEVLRALRKDPALADLPVLIVSANALPEQQTAALGLGVRGYLTKPLDLQALLAQLDALFGAPAPPPGETGGEAEVP